MAQGQTFTPGHPDAASTYEPWDSAGPSDAKNSNTTEVFAIAGSSSLHSQRMPQGSTNVGRMSQAGPSNGSVSRCGAPETADKRPRAQWRFAGQPRSCAQTQPSTTFRLPRCADARSVATRFDRANRLAERLPDRRARFSERCSAWRLMCGARRMDVRVGPRTPQPIFLAGDRQPQNRKTKKELPGADTASAIIGNANCGSHGRTLENDVATGCRSVAGLTRIASP